MNVIREAAHRLPGNWHQGSIYGGHDNYCGLGWVDKVAKEQGVDETWSLWTLMGEVAREQFPERINPFADEVAFAQFNDHRATTEDEVVAVMEKAAVRLDEVI